MHRKIDGTIIVISHQEKLLKTADRIIVLADGKVSDDGPKDIIFDEWFCDNSSQRCPKLDEGGKL